SDLGQLRTQPRTPLTPIRLDEDFVRIVADVLDIERVPTETAHTVTERHHPLPAPHVAGLSAHHQLSATLPDNRQSALRADRAVGVERSVHVVRVRLARIVRVPVPGVRPPALGVPGNRPDTPVPDEVHHPEPRRV